MDKNKKIVIGVIIGVVLIVIALLLLKGCQRKEYTVTFDSDGGSTLESIKVKENEKVKRPSNPTKDGYTFDDWYYEDKVYDFDTKVTKDMTLKAHWKAGITLKTTKVSLIIGSEEKIELLELPDGVTEDDLVYKSSDEEVVTVDKNGNLKALKIGTATITIETKDGKYKASCTVTVTDKQIEVESVSIEGASQVTVGSSIKLTVTFTPEEATNKNVKWESSDTKIATVDENGNVKGLKSGNVTITVKTENGKTATKTITVKEKSQNNDSKPQEVSPTGVSISGPTEVYVGNSINLIATVEPNSATNKSVTWSSSNNSIATVDGNGKVTGVSEGEVTITVKTSNGKEATYKVVVKSVYVITLTANKSETGSVRDYTITSVTRDGQSFKDFITFTYNNQTRKPDHIGKVISADFVSTQVKTASIVLPGGKTVTATVEIK